jgi:hypothetical protein
VSSKCGLCVAERWKVAGGLCGLPLGGGRRDEGGGKSPGSLEGRRETDLGPWTGGWKGCWTRRATVGADGRPFGASCDVPATRFVEQWKPSGSTGVFAFG